MDYSFKFSSLVIKSHQEKYVTKAFIWCVQYSFVITFDSAFNFLRHICLVNKYSKFQGQQYGWLHHRQQPSELRCVAGRNKTRSERAATSFSV